MHSKGKLIIVSGPSGSGKSTLLSEVFEKIDNRYFSVSATTRTPRPGEENGVNYWFKTREEFEAHLRAGDFLEYAEYAGNYYGTLAAPIVEQLNAGNDIFLDIEVQGALQVKAKMPEAVLVFAIPPTFEELERRLRSRCTESEETILRRLETAKREYAEAINYDYIVITDKPGAAANEIISILTAEKCKLAERKYLIREA